MLKNIIFVMGPMLLSANFLTGCVTAQQVSSGNTNQCMNVENHGYPVAGTPLKVKQCDPWRNQQWYFNKGQITGIGGMCLDVQGSAAVAGAPILYVPCDGRPSQIWNVSNNHIVGIGGMCIDIGGGEPNNLAPLILAACNGSDSQVWLLH